MRWLPLTVGLFFTACGGSSGTTDAGLPPACTEAGALQTVTSASGAYTFYVCSPATPEVGVDSFSYLVLDASGAPKDGLALAVQPWMPFMNHGSPADGNAVVTARGSGQYAVTEVVFQMVGDWELRTSITAPTSDSALPQFTISE